MVIEINTFDRDWLFKGEPKNSEQDADEKEMLGLLDKHISETPRTTE